MNTRPRALDFIRNGSRAGLLPLCLLAVLTAGCAPASEAPPERPAGIQVGNRAPELSGTLANGDSFRLADEAGGRHVLVFYRGLHCGLCRVRLEQLGTNLSGYERQGARVVAVTLDSPESSRALAEQLDLRFSILSTDSLAFETWGILHPETGLPMPAAYVVDTDGVVRFRHVGRNAGDRVTDAGLITLLRSLDDR
jgi:peroxiredoxin